MKKLIIGTAIACGASLGKIIMGGTNDVIIGAIAAIIIFGVVSKLWEKI